MWNLSSNGYDNKVQAEELLKKALKINTDENRTYGQVACLHFQMLKSRKDTVQTDTKMANRIPNFLYSRF